MHLILPYVPEAAGITAWLVRLSPHLLTSVLGLALEMRQACMWTC
jgi:hypothetical protein